MGFTWSDQRHPGSRVNFPTTPPPILINSSLPFSKVRTSSGLLKSLYSAFVITFSQIWFYLLNQPTSKGLTKNEYPKNPILPSVYHDVDLVPVFKAFISPCRVLIS